jgi:hypothetical protein
MVFQNDIIAGASGAGGGYTIDQSIRFNSADSAYLYRTPSVAGNRKTFTQSLWFKRGKISTNQFVGLTVSGSASYGLFLDSSNILNVYIYFTGSVWQGQLITSQVFRDSSSWYHFVLSVDTTQATSSDRIKIYVNGNQITAFSTANYPNQNQDTDFNSTSAHFIGQLASANYTDGYLTEINFIDGTALDATSFGETNNDGVWVPIEYTNAAGYGTNGFYITGEDSTFLGQDVRTSGDQVNSFQAAQYTGATSDYTFSDGRVEADVDNRAIRTVDTFTGDFEFTWRYVNMANFVIGLYEIDEDATFSSTSSAGNMQSMTDSWYVQTSSVASNRDIYYGGTVVVDSTTIANGDVWKMTRESGTIKVYRNGSLIHTYAQTSTNEVRLVIAQGDAAADANQIAWVDNSTLGNNFFSSGLATTDQMLDTPTLNYCTLSPIDGYGGKLTLSDGNLRAVPSTSSYCNNHGTFYVGSGKWVYECKLTTVFGEAVGWSPLGEQISGSSNRGWFMFNDGRAYINTTNQGTLGTSLSSGDYRYIFYDADNQAMWFAHCDVSSGTPTTLVYENGATKSEIETGDTTNAVFTSINAVDLAPGIWMDTSGVIETNFGQSAFYTTSDLPTGFNALNTANLATPSITDGSAHFQPTIYTGDGSSSHEINQNGNSVFEPSMVWIKSRSAATLHVIQDQVRGDFVFYPNLTNAEGATGGGWVKSFDSDGFTTDVNVQINDSGQTFVAWQWKANGAGSSNTDGTVASTVSANPTAGFSIAKWTHTTASNYTVGHGLGAVPKMILVKTTDQGTNWGVYHSDITVGNRLILNSTSAQVAGYWGANSWTSSTFSIGSVRDTNGSTAVAYCFAEIPGYSSIGSYEGNTNTDGPFVYTGFRPAFVLVKNIDAATVWPIQDTARSPFNLANAQVFANLSNAETTGYQIDILSNGFKARSADTGINGATMIYMAFAEHPFGGGGVAPATAR